jgi:hypothetical protein
MRKEFHYAIKLPTWVPAESRWLAGRAVAWCKKDLGLDSLTLKWIELEAPNEREGLPEFDMWGLPGVDWDSVSSDADVLGLGDWKTKTIYIRSHLKGWELLETVAHEAAHAMGLREEQAESYGKRTVALWKTELALRQPVNVWTKSEGIDGYSLPTWQRITVPAWALTGGVR